MMTKELKYYSSGHGPDYVYAIDEEGNEFFVHNDMSLEPVPHGSVDIMWGGLSVGEVEQLINRKDYP